MTRLTWANLKDYNKLFCSSDISNMSSYLQGGPHSSRRHATLCDYDVNGDSHQWTLHSRLFHPQRAQLRMPPIQYLPLQLRMPPIQCHYRKEVHLPMLHGGRLSPRIVSMHSLNRGIFIEFSLLTTWPTEPSSSMHFWFCQTQFRHQCVAWHFLGWQVQISYLLVS